MRRRICEPMQRLVMYDGDWYRPPICAYFVTPTWRGLPVEEGLENIHVHI